MQRRRKEEENLISTLTFRHADGSDAVAREQVRPHHDGDPEGQRVLGSQLMSGDVGERRGACGGCSASSSPAAAALLLTFAGELETDFSATTLGTSWSSESPGPRRRSGPGPQRP